MAKNRISRGRDTCFLDGQKDESCVKPLSYFSLYSTKWEKSWIVFAVFLAILSGCIPPLVNVLNGEFCSLMIDRQFPTNASSTKTHILSWFGGGRILQNASISERQDALLEDSRAWGLGCACLTFIQFLLSMISVFLLSLAASLQVSRIRILFFKSVMCKDLAWFDTHKSGNFAGHTSDNLNKLEEGIGEVIGIFVYLMVIMTFTVVLTVEFINILISFLVGWRLSLVLMVLVVPVFLSAFYTAKVQSKLAVQEMEARAKAGSSAEEVFASIRTVVAFEGENKEVERYSKYIGESKIYGIKRGMVSGLSNGFSWVLIYSSYSVAFVYGVRLIQFSEYNFSPADLLIAFFGMLTALTNFGFSATHLETFSVARGAATAVFGVINTKSKINPCSGNGDTGKDFKGEIEFKNVHFEYPSRPGVKILKGLDLKIKAGEVVAIVGGSGTGKSTILQLVQRLYDPSEGEIFIDGQNIKSLKVSWLRQQLGVVGQEPLLFSTTIRDNILYGNMLASTEDVEEAAKKANAHDFILKLKDGYNTFIGQKGSTLSGGQKQRIAIARALIRNPKILLLDEATSALDATSEKTVQAALDRAAEGRTTLIVTHRLSTIVNADRIIVLSDGVVSEDGTHTKLLETNGIYKQLLQSEAEYVKKKKSPGLETSDSKIVYEDPTVLPLGPRSTFSSANSLEKSSVKFSKGQSLDSLDHYKKIRFLEIIKWSNPEWIYVSCGSLASIIGGAALPIVCVLFGYLCGLLSLTDVNYILKQTDTYAIILLVVGVAAGVCAFVQMYCFAAAGMKLSSRLRVKAFNCIIHQEIGFFDEDKNKVGALCLRLSEDPSEIQRTLGIRLGILIQAFSTMTIGIVLSFFFNWKISLVALTTVPFVFTGVYLESLFVGRIYQTREAENASKIAVEVISNIRTVASLGKESFFIEKYSAAIREGRMNNIKKACLRSFAFAIGQTAPFFGYAVTLWYGGLLVANENLHYKYVLTVSELLIFGAWTLGQSVVIGPSFAQTKIAGGRLNYIFLRKPKVIDGYFYSSPDKRDDRYIKFSKVNFVYPTRPGIRVIENFNLHIKSGESVALMGASGSGKSTVIQLLQRFYDPNSGKISIHDVNIADYRLSSLRGRMGIVSQEPVLFDRTIQENIAYGNNDRVVPLSEVIEAAEAANIHSFIMSLPLGYNTKLGAAGTQLSGGQKQRIAIARALVRNPQILLLDEATSALDPQSESVVQETLDKAALGRTTITVAHRLSAVRNADIIYVLEKGIIKEFGTHEQLMRLEGLYYSMHGGIVDEKKSIQRTSEK